MSKFSSYAAATLPINPNTDILLLGQQNGSDSVLKTLNPSALVGAGKGVANGVATLDSNGLVSVGQLPVTKRVLNTFCAGKPASSEVIGGTIVPAAITIVQANCVAKSTVAATASTTFTIAKNGTSMGSVVFGASSTVGTVTITSGSLAVGDLISITAPATADTALANITISLSN